MLRFFFVALAAVFAASALTPAAHAADSMTLLQSFGAFGSGPGQFDHPLGAGVGDNGNVWVVDAINDRVQEWTAGGSFVRAVGSTGSGRGQFRLPEDVEARGGFVYVSDCYGQRVQRFDVAGLKPAGEFTDGLRCPQGLDVGPGGEVWVADTFNDRVLAFDPSSGAVLKTFGSLPRPRDVAVHPASGDVYVAVDADDQCVGARVTRLSASGSVLGTFGVSGAGALFCPLGVHVDAAGNVIVSDAAGRVNVYTAAGEFALALAAPAGAKAFAYPYGIATDAQCRVYVVERDAARVDVYGFAAAPFCRTLPAAGAGVAPPAVVQTGDKTPPAFSVVWPKSVSLVKASTVSMKVRCPFETCSVRSFGKVRVAGKVRWWMQIVKTRRLTAGVQGTVTLKFRKASDLRAVRRYLRRGRRPKLELVVSAGDVKNNYARKRVVRTLR
jgi:DNA-binding beta-propeller fold protein YncE